ncbi:hypothetical protein IX38_22110 [Chryseobacterium luteum]|uniref:Uncharacterized protein n=1 Tax=Chryseobacterium luteum TaxID=421531 RepID=A0A085YXT7_9FLAO|nr:hypothetical protein IX38_22110 [Chryseobacterium luteum]
MVGIWFRFIVFVSLSWEKQKYPASGNTKIAKSRYRTYFIACYLSNTMFSLSQIWQITQIYLVNLFNLYFIVGKSQGHKDFI